MIHSGFRLVLLVDTAVTWHDSALWYSTMVIASGIWSMVVNHSTAILSPASHATHPPSITRLIKVMGYLHQQHADSDAGEFRQSRRDMLRYVTRNKPSCIAGNRLESGYWRLLCYELRSLRSASYKHVVCHCRVVNRLSSPNQERDFRLNYSSTRLWRLLCDPP